MAWMIHHKLMQAMVEREARYSLSGQVQIDDGYLGGERSGGKAGLGLREQGTVCRCRVVESGRQSHPCQTHGGARLYSHRHCQLGQELLQPKGAGAV